MESPSSSAQLAGSEIHGFNTVADLDIERLMMEAQSRWFRPNEVHAILSNYWHFKIHPQPVDRPKSTLTIEYTEDMLMFDGNLIHVTKRNSQLRDYLFVMGGGRKFEGQPMQFVGILSPTMGGHGGTVLLFDRQVMRYFRKDGYNWKKKKDGKNVQEAHEKLKIGNEERVHVYYARSDEDTNFYRRSFWLLDKYLERIVLVHYRQTLEESAFPNPSPAVECTNTIPYNNMTNYNSPVMTALSASASARSDLSGSAVFSAEINSEEQRAIYSGSGSYPVNEHAQTQSNDFDWGDFEEPCADLVSHREGYVPSLVQHMQYDLLRSPHNATFLSSQGISSSGQSSEVINNNGFDSVKQASSGDFHTVEEHNRRSPSFNYINPQSQVTDVQLTLVGSSETARIIAEDVLTSQDSFGRWNYVNDESLQTLDCLQFDAPISSGDKSDAFGIMDQFYMQVPIFNIVAISPEWTYSTVETKIVVVGFFDESYKHLNRSKIYCVFSETHVSAEMVQDGVYRCTTPSHVPGFVDFYLSFDGHTPISQVLSFEHRPLPSIQSTGGLNSLEDDNCKLKKTLNLVQIRLSHLLFSTTNTMSILSNKIQPKFLKEAKKYELLTSPLLEKDWNNMLKLRGDSEISDVEDLFELFLANKLQEWLLNKVAEGSKTTPLDSRGQGVIHLCVFLDYTWAVRLFLLSGLSLDFRDAHGWTALHWAASLGREKMVAALLSAGANPSLVTDPTPQNPGGSTAADLASERGYEGLAAYLAEKGLTAHFKAMSLSGNIAAPPQTSSNNIVNSEYSENLTEQELCLKESLAAYRHAADAAGRIQAAFRERALKQQTKAVQLANPVMEATHIVAALKIQHAFRNYNRRRVMKAAARIQSHFRTWQTHKNFLHMRRQAIKIQAVFRGHLMRKQYFKIVWSVGVLEKAVLRWRLKRKGLRGMQIETTQAMKVDEEQEETVAEEDFFRIGREQAEERVNNAVVKVQSMFRSYRAQQEYRRMKLTHEEAKLEFNLDGEVGNS